MGSENQLAVDAWAARIGAKAALPDQRLNVRLVSMLSVMGGKPLDSIPQACGNWGQTKGAYRFLENDRVTVSDLQDPFVQTTAESCAHFPIVFAVQDTTSLNFTKLKKCAGLGPINDSTARGLHVHSTMALDPEGIPLGLLGQKIWLRPEEKASHQCRERPIEEKESFKWLDGIHKAHQALEKISKAKGPRLIHVADRECDVHEVFEEILDRGDGAVIRCAQDRKIEGPTQHAREAVRASPCLGTDMIEVPRAPGRPARQARVEYRAVSVRLTPNSERRPDRGMLDLNLVEVWEFDPPKDAEPLHWLLWTTEPIGTLKAVLAVVAIYRFRWRIEDFHFTLKSGCRIEDLQLETSDRLMKAIVLYWAIAMRIVGIRDRVRQTPDVPCTLEVSEDEWRVLWAVQNKRPAPERQAPPTLRQAVLWIGRLGGHLGRKGDGMPGVRTLWRGFRDLQIMVQFYRSIRRNE